MPNTEALALLIDEHLPAAANGDRAAFGKIVGGCQNGITAIALAITRDVSASEDIAQDAFLSAWKHLPRLRNRSSFLPWLRQITRNLAHDHLRRKRTEKRIDGDIDDILAVVADPTPDHPERLSRQQEEAVAAELIDELPEETREILLIYYREGQSSKQVAELLGMQDAAVRKRLSRARQSLHRNLLERLGDFARETAPTLAFTALVVGGLSMSQNAAAAAGVAGSSSLAGHLFGRSSKMIGSAGRGAAARLEVVGSKGGMLAGKFGGKFGLVAGGMVFAALAGIAIVFFGVRRHWITSTDEQERRELFWFAIAGVTVVLAFSALMGAAAWHPSEWLPAISFAGMMASLGAMNLTWLPRILARRHEREAEHDPIAAGDARRAERRMAWAGMFVGVAMGLAGLLFGWHGPV